MFEFCFTKPLYINPIRKPERIEPWTVHEISFSDSIHIRRTSKQSEDLPTSPTRPTMLGGCGRKGSDFDLAAIVWLKELRLLVVVARNATATTAIRRTTISLNILSVIVIYVVTFKLDVVIKQQQDLFNQSRKVKLRTVLEVTETFCRWLFFFDPLTCFCTCSLFLFSFAA